MSVPRSRAAAVAAAGWLWLGLHGAASGQPLELRPLPEVALDGVEPAVRTLLEDQRREVERHLASAGRDAASLDERRRRELGRAFGGLGELYLVYDLVEPARAALDNAARLDPASFRWPHLLGTLLQLERDFGGAEAAFRRALELRPEYAAAMVRLAEALLEQGRHAEAGDWYRAALDQSRTAPGYVGAAHYGLGRVALARRDPARAVTHLEQALAAQPSAGQARYQLALAHRDLGDRARARELLAQPRGALAGEVRFPDPVALELQQRVQGVGALLALGRIALGEGELAVAEERFRRALAQDPLSAAAHRSLAGVLQQQGREEEAVAAYEEAVRLEPEVAGLRYFLAELYVERVRRRFAEGGAVEGSATSSDLERLLPEAREAARADLEQAAGHLRAALDQAPDFLAGWVELAGASAGLGRRNEAIDQLGRALALRPDATDLRLFRARLLAAEGRVDEAVAEYDAIVAGGRGGEVAPARFEAARVLERAGRLEAAHDRFAAVADAVDLTPTMRAAAALQLGNLGLERGELRAAEARYRAALELDPGLAEAHRNLGTLLGRSDRFAEAAAELARALEREPENHETRFGEAMALVLAGDYAAAAQRLEHALQLHPSGAGYAHLLARVLVAAPDDAVRDGAVGLDLARRLFEALPTPEHAETLAMALAEVGRFDEALQWQTRVVQELEKAGRADLLEGARARLESYRRGQPARSPWQ
ncbi:MAG TPA: tetratricopeptide repeat protein [Thermoanaerobaculia bacterium]|nr:tetratricopeptide repeat protein [Thermoanaerobaculia bacterium]